MSSYVLSLTFIHCIIFAVALLSRIQFVEPAEVQCSMNPSELVLVLQPDILT